MSIRLLQGFEDKERWNNYVDKSLFSSLYHREEWKDILEKSFGHKAYYLLSENAVGEIDGILPLVHLKSFLFGSFLVSLPYFNYGGICANSPEVYSRLLEEGVALADNLNAKHIELREIRLLQSRLQMKSAKCTMLLNLPASSDELWNLLPSKLRSQVRKPQKEGLSIRMGREEELDSFYRVFSANMRDLGTPVYSKSFFRNILTGFPNSASICSVYKEDVPVASGFLIGFKEKLEIPWASSLRTFNHHSPNMLLYWNVLKFACDRGYRSFDFGRSTPGEGTYRFKEQWGAQPLPLYWYYWVRNGASLPQLNPKNPKYKMAIQIWKKLPVGLTQVIGPSIVRNIP